MLIDSDAFIIFGAAGLVREVGELFGVDLQNIRRLFPLPHMLERGKLARKYSPAIRERVKSWCAVIAPITEAPSAATRQLLLDVEGLHDGEAQLFGLMFENPTYQLLSSDKVAMRALTEKEELKSVYDSLSGRVACAESALLALMTRIGVGALAAAISPLREHNSMLNAVFSMGTQTPEDHCREGLSSYLSALTRDLGPSFLLNIHDV